MASNVVLKFDGIAGESIQENFNEWIECSSLGFAVMAPTSVTAGTGLASGKANVSAYNLQTVMGKHTPELMERMLNGKHHVTIEIKVLKQTGDNTGEPYWTLASKKGYIESISWSCGQDGAMYEHISFLPEEHTWEYFAQGDDGALASTGAKTYNVKTALTS